jgi:MoaA/NifB/PqqE/SkfB family radical SAM enzyme
MIAELAKPFARDEPGTLRQLYLSLSNVCNARCSYCDVHEVVPQRGAFSQADLAGVLDEAHGLGCTMVHFMGGGEPLISREFLPATAVCTRLGMDIAVTTNGSHLKDRVRAMPAEARLRLMLVSIDSRDPGTHDRIRGIPGLWQRAVDGIGECRRGRPQLRIVLNHVLTSGNIADVEAFVRWAGTVGADSVNIIPVKDVPSLAASSNEAAAFIVRGDALRVAARESGIELLFDAADASGWASERAGMATGCEYRCVFPQHALYLDLPTGAAFPCDCTVHRKPEQRFNLGNVWKEGVTAIWRGHVIAAMRRTLASADDPGCKVQCDWNNRRTNRALRAASEPRG